MEMEMRRFLLLLLSMISMIGLVACNTKVPITTADNTPTPNPTNAIMTPIVIEDETHQNEYEIVENTSNLSKDVIINYPQISGMTDADQQEKINKLIFEDIMKYVECFDGGGITIEITYDISWKSTNLLSIRYYLYYYSEGAAHPNNCFYTINIDLDSASKQKLSDIINISDDLVNKFKKDSRYTAPNDNSEELMEMLREDINLLDLASLTNADAGDNFEEMHTYFTVDSLGFSISVPHVYGDYALYEIKYNEIKDYIKDDKLILVTDTALEKTDESIEVKPTQEPQIIQLNNSLCAANEEVLICFPIADSKKCLSICIEKSQQEYIVYRFGTKEKIELEYPDDKANSWSKFIYSYYLRAGGRENEGLDLNYLTFESSGYSYKIYQEYSADSDETKVGIMVTNLSTGEEIQIEGSTDGLVGNLINLRDNDKITIEY